MITPLELFAVIVAAIVILPLAALAGYALAWIVMVTLCLLEDGIHRVRGVFR